MTDRNQQTPTLRAWRDGKGWTLQQAADYIGIPLTTYAAIERGTFPRRKALTRILAKTKLPITALGETA